MEPYSTVLVLALVGATAGSWIHCPQNDELSQCTGEAFVRLCNKMSEGDPSIELPKLDPITIPAMEVNKNAGSVLNVNMTFKDLKVSQTARDVVLKSVKFNLDKLVLNLELSRPAVHFDGQYQINGKMLWLPMWGNGDVKIRMKNVHEKFTVEGKRVTKDDKTFWELTHYDSELHPELLSVQYDNLFNGNLILEKGANILMNSNWKVIYEQIRPITDAKYSSTMEPYWSKLLLDVPLEESFPAA